MLPGVRPSICLASSPIARTCFLPRTSAMATTLGSANTIPRPLTYTSVLAVPRSMAMSADMKPSSRENIGNNLTPRGEKALGLAAPGADHKRVFRDHIAARFRPPNILPRCSVSKSQQGDAVHDTQD